MSHKLRLASSENQWLLSEAFYSLGRSRTADLRINNANVSRIHIFFFNDPERGFLVCDAGSHNGAYLNDQLIRKPEKLVEADVIRVASEELHVSFNGCFDGEDNSKASVESGCILTAVFNDRGVDWGKESKVQGRARGEWIYRIMKLVTAQGGKVVQVTDNSVSGLWDKVGSGDRDKIQAVVECSRQMNHFSLHLNDVVLGECGIDTGEHLFESHAAMHYGPIKRKELSNGQLKMMGEELRLVADVANKAAELDCPIVSTERFPSRQEDRSVTNPMLMVEVGVRRQAMVLYPLRID